MSNYINPNALSGNFTQVPNIILTTYTQHPRFDANTFLLYVTLSKYYNDNYGYAFPKQSTLTKVTGIKDRKTIRKHLDAMEELDLIEVRKPTADGKRKNNIYLFKEPVQSSAEFFRKFPEIADDAKERIKQIDDEEESDLKRLEARRQELHAEEKEAARASGEQQEEAEPAPQLEPEPAGMNDVDEDWF